MSAFVAMETYWKYCYENLKVPLSCNGIVEMAFYFFVTANIRQKGFFSCLLTTI